MKTRPPPFRCLSLPELCSPGLCPHRTGWWQREGHAQLTLVSSGPDPQGKNSSRHILVVPCSVKVEPRKATSTSPSK